MSQTCDLKVLQDPDLKQDHRFDPNSFNKLRGFEHFDPTPEEIEDEYLTDLWDLYTEDSYTIIKLGSFEGVWTVHTDMREQYSDFTGQ